MAQHIFGLLETQDATRVLIHRLQAHVPQDRISVFTRADQLPDYATKQYETDNIVDGTLIGAAIGGVLGLTATLATVLYPTAGSLVVSLGPLAGIAYGTWSGGMVGGLVDLGISPPGAQQLQRAVEAGQILVSAEVTPENHDMVQQLFRDYGADTVLTR